MLFNTKKQKNLKKRLTISTTFIYNKALRKIFTPFERTIL